MESTVKIITTTTTKNAQDQKAALTAEICQTFQKELPLIFLKLCKTVERDGILPPASP